MGADLYIEQIHKPVFERYEPFFLAAVHQRDESPPGSKAAKAAQAEVAKYNELMFSAGYFRDNYNATSVLWRMGLSWWTHVIPLCDELCHLKGKALLKFRQMVKAAQLKLPTGAQLKAEGVRLAAVGEYSVAGWHAYFRQKHRELLAFLDEAIALSTSIQCSL